jgi:hypothetical protein
VDNQPLTQQHSNMYLRPESSDLKMIHKTGLLLEKENVIHPEQQDNFQRNHYIMFCHCSTSASSEYD